MAAFSLISSEPLLLSFLGEAVAEGLRVSWLPVVNEGIHDFQVIRELFMRGERHANSRLFLRLLQIFGQGSADND